MTGIMFTIGQDVSTSDNDQVKPAGKDCCMYNQCETNNVNNVKQAMLKKFIYMYK